MTLPGDQHLDHIAGAELELTMAYAEVSEGNAGGLLADRLLQRF